MHATSISQTVLPPSRLPFRTSRAALGFLSATLLLATLLIFSTIENINRAETLMRNFLIEKGETIIHVIEAGSTTSVMHQMGTGNPLHTLLTESSKEDDIVFIRVMDRSGTVIDQAGFSTQVSLSPADITALLSSGSLRTDEDPENDTFIVSKTFHSQYHMLSMHMHMHGSLPETGHDPREDRYIISIGLLTRDFDAARGQDVHHAMFMAAILFLVGSAGLYFLFLYQRVRVAKSTLANMKLYTDSIIESIPLSLVTLDAENRIVSCNHNCETLLGRPLGEMRGKNIKTFLPQCTQCLSSVCKDPCEEPTELTTSAGTTVPVRLTSSSLVNQAGEAIGRVLIVRDMSSIRDMELQLERSRRLAALGKMATGIAHEIRNPLGTLRGFAQFFGQQAATDMEKQYADLMVSEVDRLNQTVSGLLQFARPREPQIRHVVLDELLARIFALMNPDFISRNLLFTCSRDTGVTLHADPDLLLQVLMNLLKNSINASNTGAEITLSVADDGSQVRISVTDTGRGMQEEERERMFDPFFTTGKTGTGLGLAVSHQIIEQHGGSFEVQTAPGKGTSVTVILPRKNKEAEYGQEARHDPPGRR